MKQTNSGLIGPVPEAITEFFELGSEGSPFVLDSGESLPGVSIAYQTYGSLSPAKDNAVLVFHALSGSQHISGSNVRFDEINSFWTEDCHLGWWNDFVGPGRAIDTDKYFVICANYLGGCYGSTGPSSTNPLSGLPYGSSFPRVSLWDILETQIRLLDHLCIDRLHAVFGPSIGGILALALAVKYPKRTKKVVPIASSAVLSILQRIQNFEQILAIESDPNFKGGDYYQGKCPEMGLASARMIAHKSYISLETLQRRARAELVQPDDQFAFYKISHAVESYMLHQGSRFTKRFDANTYLRIVDAWQNFDIVQDMGAESLEEVFSLCNGHQEHLVFSIDSDVCFYPDEQRLLVEVLKRAEIPVKHITVHSEKGHDSFLLEPELFGPYIDYMLRA